jgi:hypothetical protein
MMGSWRATRAKAILDSIAYSLDSGGYIETGRIVIIAEFTP